MNHNFIRPGGVAADLPDGWEDDVASSATPCSSGRTNTMTSCSPVSRSSGNGPKPSVTSPPRRRWPCRPPGPSCVRRVSRGTCAERCPTSRTTRASTTSSWARSGTTSTGTPSGSTRSESRSGSSARCWRRCPGATTGAQDAKVTPRRDGGRRRVDGGPHPPLQDFHRGLQGARGRGLCGRRVPTGRARVPFISDGTSKPYRLHIRGPSFVNLQSLPVMLRGGLIADAVAIISSVDPVMGRGRPVSHFNTTMAARARQVVAPCTPSDAVGPACRCCHLAQEQDGWPVPRAPWRGRSPSWSGSPWPRSVGRPPSTTCCTPNRSARTWSRCAPTSLASSTVATDMLAHAEERLGIRVGATTDDGLFTLEESECPADCDHPPCVQVNHRFVRTTTPGRSTSWWTS